MLRTDIKSHVLRTSDNVYEVSVMSYILKFMFLNLHLFYQFVNVIRGPVTLHWSRVRVVLSEGDLCCL